MIKIRKSEDRGVADFGWLHSKHTFSFGGYQDADHMGFGTLRVINEDIVKGGKGFATHPHQDMEIISYVLDGALEHKDSMGNGSVINKGDVQRMSAGTGITHSEYNHSSTDDVHFLQIWFLPDAKGHEPGYEQKNFSEADRYNNFKLVSSKTGREGSVSLNQDVDILVGNIDKDISYNVDSNRKVWVQVVKGNISLNEHLLNQGDGAAIEGIDVLQFTNCNNAEIIIFNMG